MKHFLLILLLLTGFSHRSHSSDVKLTVGDYNNWGWESLFIENGYIEVVIVPEIGGRVMRFAMPGDQQMAINERTLGKTYDPSTNNNGPWGEGWGYGGYKNWPSPQSFWNWPPPPRLDWGVYQYTIEHQSADSVVVFLESEIETVRAKGYQQSRRISVYKNSTVVKVEQTLTNVNGTVRDLGIWDITQTIVQHENEKDATNFSVYFATDKSILNDKKIDIQEVDEGIFRYQDTRVNKGDGKAYMNVSAGWCANVDERDEQAYYKLFEIHPEANHPDNNTNFQIYSAGNNSYIEIEVLSPLQKLAQGETMLYDEYWSAASVKGIHYHANKAGALLNASLSGTAFEGSYGIFTTGKVVLHYLNNSGQELGTSAEKTVKAAQLLTLNETVPEGTSKVLLHAFNEKGQLIGILSGQREFSVGKDLMASGELKVFPTAGKTDQLFTLTGAAVKAEQLALYTLNGQRVALENVQVHDQRLTFNIKNASRGVYVLRVNSGKNTYQQKIMIY